LIVNVPDTEFELSRDLLDVPADVPDRRDDPESPAASSSADQPAPTLPLAGETTSLVDRALGDFRLLRKLGGGGMADVYLAEQLSLKRKVAIKVLRPELLRESDDVALKRFEREARAAAGLTHPNIVQVYTIGEQDGLHYIAQEYVEGLNLREFLKRKGPPDATVAVHLMRQVAAALAKAGEAGIVHRDIKPENILITRKGQVKVGDFGLAQLAHAGERVHLTQPNITMGTPLYMSPEQVNGRTLDQRSDIYSFGVTCYHLLTGGTPFRGETALSVAVQHLNQQPRPLSEMRADLPPGLCGVVHRMMAKKPEDRYPDAGEIVQDLKLIGRALKQEPREAAETLAKFEGLLPASALPATGAWDRISRWSVRRRIVVLAGLGLVVGGIAAGIGWWLRPPNPLETPTRAVSRIAQVGSADSQYNVALLGLSGTEDEVDAWQAVIDFFPDDPRYPWLAREQLGMIYLRSLQLEEADRIFKTFINEGARSAQPALNRARGEAGLAIIANLRGEYARSQEIIRRKLMPGEGSESLVNQLDSSSELRRFVYQAQQINLRHLAGAQEPSGLSG
jgi:eukaryotic-like serine/threonine-protein kinase